MSASPATIMAASGSLSTRERMLQRLAGMDLKRVFDLDGTGNIDPLVFSRSLKIWDNTIFTDDAIADFYSWSGLVQAGGGFSSGQSICIQDLCKFVKANAPKSRHRRRASSRTGTGEVSVVSSGSTPSEAASFSAAPRSCKTREPSAGGGGGGGSTGSRPPKVSRSKSGRKLRAALTPSDRTGDSVSEANSVARCSEVEVPQEAPVTHETTLPRETKEAWSAPPLQPAEVASGSGGRAPVGRNEGTSSTPAMAKDLADLATGEAWASASPVDGSKEAPGPEAAREGEDAEVAAAAGAVLEAVVPLEPPPVGHAAGEWEVASAIDADLAEPPAQVAQPAQLVATDPVDPTLEAALKFAEEGLSLTMAFENVEYAALMANLALKQAFETTAKAKISAEVGLPSENVVLQLSAGSVIVSAVVVPPVDFDLPALQSKLSSSKTLGTSVLGGVAALSGISDVTTGDIRVGSVVVDKTATKNVLGVARRQVEQAVAERRQQQLPPPQQQPQEQQQKEEPAQPLQQAKLEQPVQKEEPVRGAAVASAIADAAATIDVVPERAVAAVHEPAQAPAVSSAAPADARVDGPRAASAREEELVPSAAAAAAPAAAAASSSTSGAKAASEKASAQKRSGPAPPPPSAALISRLAHLNVLRVLDVDGSGLIDSDVLKCSLQIFDPVVFSDDACDSLIYAACKGRHNDGKSRVRILDLAYLIGAPVFYPVTSIPEQGSDEEGAEDDDGGFDDFDMEGVATAYPTTPTMDHEMTGMLKVAMNSIEQMSEDEWAGCSSTLMTARTEVEGAVADPQNARVVVNELKGASAGCSIRRHEMRGMTLRQLKRVMNYVEEHCVRESWYDPETEELLSPDLVDMHCLREWVLKPATRERQCSFVEWIAPRPSMQRPTWYVSHCAGPVKDFVQCLMEHAKRHHYTDDACYWVDAFATTPWKDHNENQLWQKVIGETEGTVQVIGHGSVAYLEVGAHSELDGDADPFAGVRYLSPRMDAASAAARGAFG